MLKNLRCSIMQFVCLINLIIHWRKCVYINNQYYDKYHLPIVIDNSVLLNMLIIHLICIVLSCAVNIQSHNRLCNWYINIVKINNNINLLKSNNMYWFQYKKWNYSEIKKHQSLILINSYRPSVFNNE